MLQLDTNLRAARMLQAGRVTVTFTSPSGQHITLAAKCRAPEEEGGRWAGCPLTEAKVIFIEVPNSGGFGDKVGKVTRSKGFVPDTRADEARVWCARKMLAWLAGEELPEGLSAAEEERCGRCGRQLTDPVSIARGIGPECYGRETGSEHQHKSQPAAETSDGSEALRQITSGERQATPGELPGKSDGRDRQGVAYGHGDWRARQRVADEQIADSTGRKPQSTKAQRRAELLANASQLTSLPGESWEDMFRDRATEMGLELPR